MNSLPDFQKLLSNYQNTGASTPLEPSDDHLSRGDRASIAIFNFAVDVGYFVAFVPAHLICGFWAGMRDAWRKANE